MERFLQKQMKQQQQGETITIDDNSQEQQQQGNNGEDFLNVLFDPGKNVEEKAGGYSVKGTTDIDVSAALTALWINLGIFVFLILSYELFSRLIPSVYRSRTSAHNKDDSSRKRKSSKKSKKDQQQDDLLRNISLPPSWMPLGWVPSVLKVSWKQLRKVGGLDAYMFIRYIRMNLQIATVSAIWGCLILWPTYASGNNNAMGWYHLSMANITLEDWRLWIPTVFMWLQTFYVMFIMNEEYKHYLMCRMDFLATTTLPAYLFNSSSRSFSNHNSPSPNDDEEEAEPQGDNNNNKIINQQQYKYSLMIEEVPHELRSDYGIYQYFNTLFPNKVHSACIVMNLPELSSIVEKRKRVLKRLEKCLTIQHITGRKPVHIVGRPKVRCCGIERLSPILPCVGKKKIDLSDEDGQLPQRGERVDSINYYTRYLNILNEKIHTIQEEKRALAQKGDETAVRASQWISHQIGVASDVIASGGASTTRALFSSPSRRRHEELPSSASSVASSSLAGDQEIENDLIIGFTAPAEKVTFWRIFRKVGFDFLWGSLSSLHKQVDVFVDTMVGATMSSTAFVTFKDLVTVSCAVRAPLSSEKGVLNVSMAPEPRDIKWDNAHINQSWSLGRTWIANAFLFVGVLLWSIPVATLQAFSNLESLSTIPGMKWLGHLNRGEFATFVNSYLPVVALLALIMILPVIFQLIATKYEFLKTESGVQKSILSRFFLYQLANIYVTVTAGSALDSLANILDHPSNAFKILGDSIPKVVGYFVLLLMTKILAGLPIVLLRVWPLIRMLTLKLCCREKILTQGELDEMYKQRTLLYGWEYPTQLLVVVICFTYSIISPVILPVGAVYFLGAFIVYKKQVLVVYNPNYESGGENFPAACHRTLWGLVCGQVTLIGYTILKHGIYQPLVLLPLPFYTISMISVFRRVYEEPGRHLSLERAIDLDKDTSEAKIADFGEDVYRQPGLQEGDVHARPYRRDEDTSSNVSVPGLSNFSGGSQKIV